MLECAFIYQPQLSQYKLSAEHPFKPVRLELTRSLLEQWHRLTSSHLITPTPFDKALLLTAHSPHYIEAVQQASDGHLPQEAYRFGLGTGDNPIFHGMHDAVTLVVAGTVTAADLVASGKARRAVNIAGGLHHAHRGHASGFCIYNDLSIAIDYLISHYQLRVAYVDLDAHHGDGVQAHFYSRSDVLTISMHESGRYLFPGTGFTDELGEGEGYGYSLNIPLQPHSDDISYETCFETVIPEALKLFQPDIIVLQAGADMHHYDPLAHLDISMQAQQRSYIRMCELADNLCEGRMIATGGGGYDAYRTAPRTWASLWGALSNQVLPHDLPQTWLERWQPESPTPLSATLHDAPDLWEPHPQAQAITEANMQTVQPLMGALDHITR